MRYILLLLFYVMISCNSDKTPYWIRVSNECYDSTFIKYKKDSLLFTELEILLSNYYDTLKQIDSVIYKDELGLKIKDSLLANKLNLLFNSNKIDHMTIHRYIPKTILFEYTEYFKSTINEPFHIGFKLYPYPSRGLFFIYDSTIVQKSPDLNIVLYDSIWSNYEIYYRLSDYWHLGMFVEKSVLFEYGE